MSRISACVFAVTLLLAGFGCSNDAADDGAAGTGGTGAAGSGGAAGSVGSGGQGGGQGGSGGAAGMSAASLHSLADQCRAQGGSDAEALCKGIEQLLFGLASACRGPAPPEVCAQISGEVIAESEVLAFEQAWVARAQALQRQLGNPVPFHDAEFPATHNSFNATDSNTPQTLSGSDSNQKYSVTDQLRMGIRAVEIDVHWMPGPEGTPDSQFREPMVCHGNVNHFGCTYEKPLSEELADLRVWLDAHPAEVIILYLEANIAEQIDDTSQSFEVTAKTVEAALGTTSARDLIYRPAEHGAACDNDAPITDPTAWINLSRDRIARAGKQVFIFTGTCGVGEAWPALAHRKKDPHYRETSENSYEGFSYPDCMTATEAAFSAEEYATKWTRLYEDSTLLAVLTGGARTAITADNVREMLRCGVNMPSLDQVKPDDPRLAAFVWSWAENEPAVDEAKRCARLDSAGRFVAADCATELPAACARTADPRDWVLGAASGWSTASCPTGYEFSVPRTASHNEALKAARQAAGAATIWLNYTRPAGQPEAWQVPAR